MSDGLDRKVALGLALTVALLLAVGVYWVTEPSRQEAASDKFSFTAAEIYAQECFYCHGRQGLGGIGPSLRETKLDEEGLIRTISRGVTVMPAWAREEGGNLTSFQVRSLAALILSWDEKVVEEALARHPLPKAPDPPPYPPAPFAGMKNPYPWGDEDALRMGKLLYELACVRCHERRSGDPTSFNFMSPVWARGVEEHPDYYYWTITEGRLWEGRGMPAHKLYLPDKQRWWVLNYLWSVGKEYEKRYLSLGKAVAAGP